MITQQTGNLLTNIQPGDTVLHGVNCQGVAGKGFALSLRQQFPAAFAPYFAACTAHSLTPGNIVAWHGQQITILHLATQNFYGKRGGATPAWIEQALAKARNYLSPDTRALMPQIGAGLGTLDWTNQVFPIIHRLFADWPGNL